jgi:hypothetical protein
MIQRMNPLSPNQILPQLSLKPTTRQRKRPQTDAAGDEKDAAESQANS